MRVLALNLQEINAYMLISVKKNSSIVNSNRSEKFYSSQQRIITREIVFQKAVRTVLKS